MREELLNYYLILFPECANGCPGSYNLTSMTLEYRRECRQSNLLESLTSSTAKMTEDSNNNSSNRKADLEYAHLLRIQDDKAEIVRERTEWQSKEKHNLSSKWNRNPRFLFFSCHFLFSSFSSSSLPSISLLHGMTQPKKKKIKTR